MSKEYVLVHNIGNINHPNYVTQEKIIVSSYIRCDGIYLSVYENRELLKGKDVILYVIGDLVGKDNSFDLQNVPKLERFCTQEQIDELVSDGAKLGWHTWSHRNLTTLTDEEIKRELEPPFDTEFLACPYEQVDDRVRNIAKSMGFKYIV